MKTLWVIALTAWPGSALFGQVVIAPERPERMAADTVPVFEVATIKISSPEAGGRRFFVNGREFHTLNTSVIDLVGFAYGVDARQITGGPAWLESEKYDVVAKPE